MRKNKVVLTGIYTLTANLVLKVKKKQKQNPRKNSAQYVAEYIIWNCVSFSPDGTQNKHCSLKGLYAGLLKMIVGVLTTCHTQ